jgi:cytochrome c-type biogenesis protein CcmH/NrfF
VRRAALIALALVAVSAPAAAAAVKPRTSLSAIEPQVMCVTCQIPLEVAVSPAADQERQFIVQLIAQGDTAAQVKSELVAEYGEAVLALPPDRGFNVVVYVIPIVVVALALALVALLLPRWRRNRRDAPTPAAADGMPSAAESARLDAELSRFDV